MRAFCLYRQRGFTFIELMITLAILGVLLLMAAPMAQVSAQRQREAELRTALGQIREAIDAYKRATDQGRIAMKIGDSGYPKRLEDLVDGVVDQKSPARQNMYFLRHLPRDPFTEDDRISAAETWGKRSYASPPDDPAEGDDVFDVYTKSDMVGLNGVPLKQW